MSNAIFDFQRIVGLGIGRVVRSENSAAKVGEYLSGFFGWFHVEKKKNSHPHYDNIHQEHQQFVIKKDLEGLDVLQNPHKLPLSTFLGVLGMPGIIHFHFGNLNCGY